MEWISLLIAIISLFLGYFGAKGELEKWHINRKLPKLINELEFYNHMHSNSTALITYLLETLIIISAIVGGAVLLYANTYPHHNNYPAIGAIIIWLASATVYLFSVYRLGRYWRSTIKFKKTTDRINKEIAELQSRISTKPVIAESSTE